MWKHDNKSTTFFISYSFRLCLSQRTRLSRETNDTKESRPLEKPLLTSLDECVLCCLCTRTDGIEVVRPFRPLDKRGKRLQKRLLSSRWTVSVSKRSPVSMLVVDAPYSERQRRNPEQRLVSVGCAAQWGKRAPDRYRGTRVYISKLSKKSDNFVCSCSKNPRLRRMKQAIQNS